MATLLHKHFLGLSGLACGMALDTAATAQRIIDHQLEVIRQEVKARTGVDIGNAAGSHQAYVDRELFKWLQNEAHQGESPGKAAYMKLKGLMNHHHKTFSGIIDGIENLPQPVRQWFELQIVLQKHSSKLYEEHFAADMFYRIGKLFTDEGTLFKPPYNHQFIAEDADRNIVAIDPKEIAAYFAEGAKRPYPRIIMTSSHAQGETLEDASKILNGIERMAEDAGHKLNRAAANTPIETGQTLVFMACDTESNPLLNAAKLGYRLSELKDVEQGRADRFKEVSPGARRLARFMLRCMAKDQNLVEIDDQDIRHPQRLADQLGEGAPLVLQADAAEIAHHLLLWGYSKGGNVVSDAMRYLVSEMQSKTKDGKPVVMLDASRAADDPAEIRAKRELIGNFKLVAAAAREKALTKALKEAGVKRCAINNRFDPIINHHDYRSSHNDVKITMDGERGEDAHKPECAMGTLDKSGFFIRDSRVLAFCRQFFDPECREIEFGRHL